ncbi:Mrp/NBP35 family ATP-binding protein [Aquiluna sp.]|nr:Mrp/NBP35 family ATP-binding protein [Aquiluna sp.]
MTAKALSALSSVIDPELRLPITDLGMVGEIQEEPNSVKVVIKLTIVGCPAAQSIERDVNEALAAKFKHVEVVMTTMSQEERAALTKKLRGDRPAKFNPFVEKDNLTKVIFVSSGKGGVGKSTLTVNLAVALAGLGQKVGLLDADIFGYSVPQLMGVNQAPTKVDHLMLPPIAHEVKLISIGFFVSDNQPVAWRGPMLHRAVEQFLTDVFWGDLDFLLVDLPPGTGDVAISLGQLLPKAQSLVVTTPQHTAAIVAERSGAIGLQTGQSVLGVIENMSYLPSENGPIEIFGAGGGEAVAKRLSELSGSEVQVLGKIPLSQGLRESADKALPIAISNPQDTAAIEIVKIAKKLIATPRGLSGKSLKITPS